MTRKEILLALIDYYAGGNKAKFAKQLGVKPQTINTWLARDTFDIDTLYSKCEGVSGDWLLSGDGNMISGCGAEHKKIPIYSVTTIGGYNDTVANVEVPGNALAWIDAGDWFPEATAAIHHYGDSMVEYPSGSILALKRVIDPSVILNGRNYVIETDDFRVTKQLQDDGEAFIAYSTNRETYPDGRLVHAPIRIPKISIRHIDLVLGCVTKEYSNGVIPIIK